MCVGKGVLVHCFVMQLLLSLYVCVAGDVSSLFCDVLSISVCQVNDLIFRILRLG